MAIVVYPPSVWYDPLKKDKGDHMKHTDVTGRRIKPGDVCGLATRRGSDTKQEVIVIRELHADWIRGTKIVKENGEVKLVNTHKLVTPDHMIITGLTEQEAIELARIRS